MQVFMKKVGKSQKKRGETEAHWDFELFSSSNYISPLLNRPQGCQGC